MERLERLKHFHCLFILQIWKKNLISSKQNIVGLRVNENIKSRPTVHPTDTHL
jgi:hypothetical protein